VRVKVDSDEYDEDFEGEEGVIECYVIRMDC
jgi:hypothetical protein